MIETSALRMSPACRTLSPWRHFTVAGIVALVFLAVLPMLINMRDQWNEPRCDKPHETFVMHITQAATPNVTLPIVCVQDNVTGEVRDVLPPPRAE